MHNAFLNIDNRKMSKSKGNFFTVREISEKYDLQVLRFFMLSAHYRSPLNFSASLMEASKNGLDRILTAVERLDELMDRVLPSDDMTQKELGLITGRVRELVKKYEASMEDDFNTADAIAALFELVKLCNTEADEQSTRTFLMQLKTTIEDLCQVLGIETKREAQLLDSEIEELIAKRQQARKEKNFALADEIRDQLTQMGILLEDTREGVKWKKA